MLTFFRRIRKGLLNSGNTSRYLVYAIGEVALVVIGILIALAINNMNIDRINKEKESVYLRNIARDLSEQLEKIKIQTQYETIISNLASPIIEYYKVHQGFKIDSSFTLSVGKLTGRKTFVKQASTYIELLSSGNIDIIRDNTLKDAIIKYYQELERVELVINKNSNLYVDEVFVPNMIGLSEIQISGEFDNLSSYIPKAKVKLVDLNEKRLKSITEEILKNPENELRLINSINFRNFISVIHLSMLPEIEDKTTKLLNQVENR